METDTRTYALLDSFVIHSTQPILKIKSDNTALTPLDIPNFKLPSKFYMILLHKRGRLH